MSVETELQQLNRWLAAITLLLAIQLLYDVPIDENIEALRLIVFIIALVAVVPLLRWFWGWAEPRIGRGTEQRSRQENRSAADAQRDGEQPSQTESEE